MAAQSFFFLQQHGDATCACIVLPDARVVVFALVVMTATIIMFWRRGERRHPDDCEVVALFANPRIPRLHPLSFGQDLKFLFRTVPRGELAVEPAASLYTARRALVQHRPRILMFSGHTIGENNIALETPDGHFDREIAADPDIIMSLLTSLSRPDALSADAAANLERHLNDQQATALAMPHCARGWMERAAAERAIAVASPEVHRQISSAVPTSSVAGGFREPDQALNRLRCVLLNGCHTHRIGRRILAAVPNVAVVCWTTVTEDKAARSFAVGFMTHCVKLSNQLERSGSGGAALRVVQEAFDAGCAGFLDAGFTFGDPFDYLHQPGHPHLTRPEFRTCQSCTPPVHGQVLMLHSGEDGAVVETWGSKTCVGISPSGSTAPWSLMRTSSNNVLAALGVGAAPRLSRSSQSI